MKTNFTTNYTGNRFEVSYLNGTKMDPKNNKTASNFFKNTATPEEQDYFYKKQYILNPEKDTEDGLVLTRRLNGTHFNSYSTEDFGDSVMGLEYFGLQMNVHQNY